MTQRLGLFPAISESLLFPPAVLRQCADLWRDLAEPGWAPRIAGLDTAEGGPDRFALAAAWGRDAVSLWTRYQGGLTAGLSGDSALARAMVCPECEGKSCERCWSGLAPLYVGRLREIPKSDDPEEMARRSALPHGQDPEYRIDAGGGGYYLQAPLRRRQCRVTAVHFGGEARQIADSGREYRNQRASMFGALALAARIGALALPPRETGPLEAELHDALALLEWVRVDLKGGVFWRLPDKADIASALAVGSPDPLDAVGLLESTAPPQQGAGGRAEFAAWG